MKKIKIPKVSKPPKKTFHFAKVLLISLGGFLLIAGIFLANWQMNQDKQCYRVHETTSKPPGQLRTAQDWFDQGNYDYDIGSCAKATMDYTFALAKDPNMAVAYNNRAYTYMRMQNYEMALPDLDKAIELRPDYVYAIRNRAAIQKSYLKKETR